LCFLWRHGFIPIIGCILVKKTNPPILLHNPALYPSEN
jgi:hypothetical protein